MTIPSLRPWAFLAAILVVLALTGAIAITLVLHGASIFLGPIVAPVLWLLHDLIRPPD